MSDLNPEKLDETFVQDVFVLNLQRAIQACIDMANIIIALKGFKLPTTYKDSFQTLAENKIIEHALAREMMKMVGFRNILAHDYAEINYDIVYDVLQNKLFDIENLIKLIENIIC